MAGEIHGIIGREDAWRMWAPYDLRGVSELESTVDIAQVSDEDYEQIWRGASEAQQEQMSAVDTDSEEGVEEFWRMFEATYQQQQCSAEHQRKMAAEDGQAYVQKIGAGVLRLAEGGIFTDNQAQLIQERLWGPDRNPYMRYVPMSQLEFARLFYKYDHEYPETITDSVLFVNGVLASAHLLDHGELQRARHNRLHESVHSVSGVELYDTTQVDGLRYPQASAVGTWTCPVTTEFTAGDDYSDCENNELNEGWTDFITRELMRIEPSLGVPLEGAQGYGDWAKTVGKLVTDYPQLYRMLTEATLIDATFAEPNAKREAIADLHIYADKVLGTADALTKLFQANGGSILAVHKKGAKKSET